MKNEWQQLSIECHNLIRAGHTDEAVQMLQKINLSQVPREFALELGTLCRRAGALSQALRILRPIVLAGSSGLSVSATPAEVGEYSISLFKSGCVYEALHWLDTIKGQEVGEADLYRGYAHIMEWDYHHAVKPLKNFIQQAPDSFTKLVAKVNLSAALINTNQLSIADELIQANIFEAEKYNNLRLKANSYELLSQIAFKRTNYEEASDYIEKAWQILSVDKSIDQLFLIKWQAILAAVKSNDITKLITAKNAAKERSHFETLRDLDFYELKIKFSQETFNKLYCGTPFVAYREKLKQEFGNQIDADRVFTLGEGPSTVLDIESMSIDDVPFTITPQLHHTFMAIWSDLYRPRSVGSLFEKIFQGEYFDINSSPNRVHRLVARLRTWLKIHDLPVTIDFEHGGFVGRIDGHLQLRLKAHDGEDESPKPGLELKWTRAELLLKDMAEFSAEELAEKIEQNHSSATRLLKWATANNKVIKKGAGRSCRYSLIK